MRVQPGDEFAFRRPTDFVSTRLFADVSGDVVTLRNSAGNAMIVCPRSSLATLLRHGSLTFA